VVQYLPLRRALTNNVRIRCTWRCQAHLAMPGAPGDPQVHLEMHRRTWQVRFFEKSTTPGAPGNLQVHLGVPTPPQAHLLRLRSESRRACRQVERLHKPLVKPKAQPTASARGDAQRGFQFPRGGGGWVAYFVNPPIWFCMLSKPCARERTALSPAD
jgi:hypothetical protein